ncbi:hypothetical protein D3C72_1335180 [compost metagenome]
MQPASPTGTLIRKIQCQEAYCTSQPPSVGPSSGPMSPGMATKLIACRNSPRGTVRSSARRPTGSSSAPPRPCTTRAATSCPSPCESAHSTEPAANSTMAQKKTRRVPKRSAIQPEAGISIAIVSA